MPCYHPITGYLVGKKDNGKKDIVWSKPAAYKEEINVGCGQCIGCRLGRAQKWALRCSHEMQLHSENTFITLTYDDEHLPNDYSLQKHHLQKFFKRLRRAIEPKKISYFACGEYGETTWRPHYHAIVFGYGFPDRIPATFVQSENPYFLSAQLAGLWPDGNHAITDANFQTAAYVARYVLKKITGDMAEDHYTRTIMDWNEHTGEIYYYKENCELTPEFATMSRNPAIGLNWFKKYKTDVYPSDFLIVDGYKVPVPEYYDKLFEDEQAYEYEMVKFRRRLHHILDPDKPSLARLNDIELVKKMKLATNERKL